MTLRQSRSTIGLRDGEPLGALVQQGGGRGEELVVREMGAGALSAALASRVVSSVQGGGAGRRRSGPRRGS
jgi:hypothetical protein